MGDLEEAEILDNPPVDDGRTIDESGQPVRPPRRRPLRVSQQPPGKQFSILKGWVRLDMAHLGPWYKDATFWFAFRAGEQWTDEDLALLRDQNRPHIVFNRVLTIMKAVAGMEINGRHEIAFLPRGTEDTAGNEVLSAASKWMADGCDGEDEESQSFDDCATCGIGVVENRMSYEDDPTGMYIEESFDPREFGYDRGAKKKNVSDSRRMHRRRKMALSDALAMFPDYTREEIDAVWADEGLDDASIKSIEEKRRRTSEDYDDEYDDDCEVTIVQIQWIEKETYYIVADALTNSRAEVSEEQYERLAQRMKLLGMPLYAARMTRKVFKQAFLGAEGTMLKAAHPAPLGNQFSWKVITGEFDKVKRTFFGLVKPMRDPQMWANKWVSQILHILNSTAKGGILAEEEAFADQREAEDSYAMADEITWVSNGALSGAKPKIMPKPGTGMTEGYVALLAFAISSIKDTVGINLELLGQQDQNQPGVLEAMRKQAGMTVLATLFDSLRRFRKQTGRARLFCIQNFLSDGRLIRVTGGDSKPQAVALAKEKTFGEYDVVVDDTPTSPNQKEQNWAIIQPLLAVFKDQLIGNPMVLAMLLEYSPLPSRVVEAIKGFIEKQQNDPTALQKQQRVEQLQEGLVVSEIEKNQSTANLNNQKAGGAQATAMYDIAIARNLLEDNKREELKSYLAQFEGQAKVVKAHADARTAEAKAAAANAEIPIKAFDAHTTRLDAETKRMKAESDHRKNLASALIEHISGLAGAQRDIAAAHKDRVTAHKEARTPIEQPGAR